MAEQKDTLVSKSYARILDVVSEGEIEGLVDGARSIYLDDTPLQTLINGVPVNNFADIAWTERKGTQAQDYIEGFPSVENQINVGAEVKLATPYVRTITNADLDSVRITIQIPALTVTDINTGDIRGTDIPIEISLSSNGGPYASQVKEYIIGKASSPYQHSYVVKLAGDPPWTIKVERLAAESTSAYIQNKLFVASITEIIESKLRYPNSALVGMVLDASQFSTLPTRGYHIRGIKVRVPDNTTTREDGSLEYDGNPWTGNYRVSWTSNPAWVLFDLLTSARYGLGSYLDESAIDKWAFYQAGRYADELVPNGKGGLEPRFSANLYIQSREEAFKVIQNLAAIFRGMLFWQGGTLTLSQDAPTDPSYLFTAANVIDGAFTYQGASLKARHSVALVTWLDPSDMYRQKVAYVEDADAVARFGIIETEIAAMGCTSEAQAIRVGKWLLYTEQNESETVSFRTGLEGAMVRPGQVVAISDPVRAGERMGGRIAAGTVDSVTVDSDLSVDPVGAELSVMLQTGAVEVRTVTSAAGRVLSVGIPFSEAPGAPSVWMLQTPAIENQYFRVISVAEPEPGIYEISALAYRPEKYDAVESGIELEERTISSLVVKPETPINLTISENLYEYNNDVRVKVTASWIAPVGATSYLVSYRIDNGNAILLPETRNSEVEILDARAGLYEFTVYALNSLGARSVPALGVREIYGRSAPPADVENFSMIPNQGLAYLTWDKAIDLDVLVGGTVRIRHTPRTTGQRWADAVDILPALAGTHTSAQAPLLAGTYLAKFYDSSGVASDNAALIVTTVPEALALNVVETVTESPTFAGSKTALTVYEPVNALMLISALTIDELLATIDEVPLFDFIGGVAPFGEYFFDNSIDLGAVYPTRLKAFIDFEVYNIGSFIDQRAGLIDTWADIDGEKIDNANAVAYVRTTIDDPGASPTWTEWKPFFAGSYTARAFEFKLILTSTDSSVNGLVKSLSVSVDMEDRTLNIGNLTTTASGGLRVDFAEPFHTSPAVALTAFGMSSGDYYEITNRSATGFDVSFRNSGGSFVARTFDVIAKGYGRKLSA